MIDFEFALQSWAGIAESLDAAGVDSGLPRPGAVVDSADQADVTDGAFVA